MRLLRCVIPLSMTAAALAQEGVVGGPSLGLLHDASTRALHLVNGVPAAALMTEALPSSDGLAWLQAAPGGQYALGVSSETGRLEWMTATGRAELETLPANAAGVRFSPTGRAAALLLEGRALAVKRSGDSLESGWEFAHEPGAALAMSDDGQLALSLAAGRLTRHHADGTVEPLALEQVRAVAFAENSNDILALTEEPGMLLVRHDGKWSRLALPDRLANPVAVAGTDEYLLVASEDGVLARLRRDGSAVESLECGCKAATLTRMGRAHLYRVNDAGDGPVWLLDAGEAQPRLLFIPPAVKEAE